MGLGDVTQEAGLRLWAEPHDEQRRTRFPAPPPDGGCGGAGRKCFRLRPPLRSLSRLCRPRERGRAPEVEGPCCWVTPREVLGEWRVLRKGSAWPAGE